MPKNEKNQTIYNTGTATANSMLIGNDISTSVPLNNTITISGGYGSIGSSGFGNWISSSPYSSIVKPSINECEIILDVVKCTAEIIDFTKTRTKYTINRFIDKGISVERDLEPGEIKKAVDFKRNQEVLLEFDISDGDEERYGKKYVSKTDFTYINFPIINQIRATTIANDLVTVQPLGAPNGQLFHLDYVYDNVTNTPNNITTLITTNGTTTAGVLDSQYICTNGQTTCVDSSAFSLQC